MIDKRYAVECPDCGVEWTPDDFDPCIICDGPSFAPLDEPMCWECFRQRHDLNDPDVRDFTGYFTRCWDCYERYRLAESAS
jgi:hypothetical protein